MEGFAPASKNSSKQNSSQSRILEREVLQFIQGLKLRCCDPAEFSFDILVNLL